MLFVILDYQKNKQRKNQTHFLLGKRVRIKIYIQNILRTYWLQKANWSTSFVSTQCRLS